MEIMKIKILLAATGLSYRQAGNMLGVSTVSVKSWLSGRRNVPPLVIDRLYEYYDFMMRWADEQIWPVPDIETDEDALRNGFYSVASYRIAASKVFFENI